MNVTVKTRHMQGTQALNEYVESKCDRLERYYDGVQSVEVILDHEADQAVAEIVVSARKKHTFVASHRDPDMYASIDHCIDKVAEQLRRFKDKVRNRQASTHAQVARQVAQQQSEAQDS